MSARSTGVADPARRSPSAAAAAAATVRSGVAGKLMCGPSAMATPQLHMAQVGSISTAARNARSASSTLKANISRNPWSK